MIRMVLLFAFIFGKVNAEGSCTVDEDKPTVVPLDASIFNPVTDADYLCDQFGRLGTCQEENIYKRLIERSNAQRQLIQAEFQIGCSGKTLYDECKRCMALELQDVIKGLLQTREQYMAELLHKSIKLLDDDDILVNILNTRGDEEIQAIKDEYYAIEGVHLITDIDNKMSGQYKKIMQLEVMGARDTDPTINIHKAQRDAQSLIADPLNPLPSAKTDTYIEILMRQHYNQLCVVFEEYTTLTGCDITEGIKNDTDKGVRQSLLAVVGMVRNRHVYYTAEFDKVWGLIDKDRLQQYLTIILSEENLDNVKTAYEEEYGRSLVDDVKSNNKGAHKNVLLLLMGESIEDEDEITLQ